MKKFFLLVLLSFLCMPYVFAKPIHTTVYKSMQSQSYRQNYRNNINNKIVPYWQAQSNFATRNRVYQNYTQYDNALQQYNNVRQESRSFQK